MDKQQVIEQIRTRYLLVADTLDERGRRAVAASEALVLGWGGLAVVARATGLARATIGLGLKELRGTIPAAQPGRIRRPGGGRKKLRLTDPGIMVALEQLVEPTTRGDPESPLRWTSLSLRKLAAALTERGHAVSHQWVAEALRALDWLLAGLEWQKMRHWNELSYDKFS